MILGQTRENRRNALRLDALSLAPIKPDDRSLWDNTRCLHSHEDILSQLRAGASAWVFMISGHRRYRGAVSLPDLLRADPDATIADLVTHSCSVTADAELEDVARLMTDYDLTVVPVLDDQEHPIGVVTVDDILELLLPPPGRRFGIFGGS
jgi:Mg/Co/Ni transporter MgtE